MTPIGENLVSLPELSWCHLERLTGPFGLYEHAFHDLPRLSHGHCTDDNARALVVIARAGDHGRVQPYLGFVLDAEIPSGWRNRMTTDGVWLHQPWSDDATGRAVWGLGELVGSGYEDHRVTTALQRGLRHHSPHPRATAYQVLGATAAHPNFVDRTLLTSLVDRLLRPGRGRWLWPEPRLSYANARIPEALIRGGAVLGDEQTMDDGLRLLAWLVEVERGQHGFSFTPVGGRGPEDSGPGFDQQPIEAWAMVDACHAAWTVDGSSVWRELMMEAAQWFLGRNDVGADLYDPWTGAGFDGLHCEGVNQNRGAESTLAALASMWRLRVGSRGE